jgi:hypothetical protein
VPHPPAPAIVSHREHAVPSAGGALGHSVDAGSAGGDGAGAGALAASPPTDWLCASPGEEGADAQAASPKTKKVNVRIMFISCHWAQSSKPVRPRSHLRF